MSIKIFTDMIEPEAVAQIERIAALEAFKDAKIRIMPDVHAGKGCVCGFTADLGDKVVPNLIGVDIGCGMLTTEIGNVDIDYNRLDQIIRQKIPSGWHVRSASIPLDENTAERIDPLKCIAQITDGQIARFGLSLGTLGGGNHFIEIDVDRTGCKYLVVHTGSRNFGKVVCDYWQGVAYRRLMESVPSLRNMINDAKSTISDPRSLPGMIERMRQSHRRMCEVAEDNKELAFIEGPDREGYIHDMRIAQHWARVNRESIARIICSEMKFEVRAQFTTMHNYLGDDNIIRKSAISARAGEKVLIPLNMRDGSVLAVGKGNADWNMSAPHGAGRLMSRSKAKATISLEEYRKTMNGIWSSSVSMETIDEAPLAYKPSERIIEQIADTVDVIETIKPVYNFKAST